MTALRTAGVLCRIPVAVFTATAAFTGTVLATPGYSIRTLPVVAVFVLSCGASALNQYQEREIDALMERTKRRPLPAGTISPHAVLILSAVLIIAGLALSAACGNMPLVLGSLAVCWYNGVYTPLKRKTAFAAVYGAPAGMLPPAIGWTAAGGDITDPRLITLAVFFFLWQVPHFWLLLLRNHADVQRSGLPDLMTIIPEDRLARITGIWILATAAAGLAFPLFGMAGGPLPVTLLAVTTVAMMSTAAVLTVQIKSLPAAFIMVNIFLFVLMCALSTNAILQRSW